MVFTYFDSEQAITSQILMSVVSTLRVAVFPVTTIEEFRHQMIQVADSYRAKKQEAYSCDPRFARNLSL